jgi:hypothetical protein
VAYIFHSLASLLSVNLGGAWDVCFGIIMIIIRYPGMGSGEPIFIIGVCAACYYKHVSLCLWLYVCVYVIGEMKMLDSTKY